MFKRKKADKIEELKKSLDEHLAITAIIQIYSEAREGGYIEDALEIALEITRKFPENDIGWVFVAETLYELGNYQGAIQAFEKTLQYLKEDSFDKDELKIKLANCYHHIEKYDESIKILEDILKENPDFVKAKTNIGINKIHLGDYKSALDILLEVVEERLDDENAWGGIVDCYFHLKDYEKAKTKVQEFLEIFPRSGTMWLKLAEVQLYGEENWLEASESYKKAFSHDYDNIIAMIGYAACQVTLGNYEEAILYHRKVHDRLSKQFKTAPEIEQLYDEHPELTSTMNDIILSMAKNDIHKEVIANIQLLDKELKENKASKTQQSVREPLKIEEHIDQPVEIIEQQKDDLLVDFLTTNNNNGNGDIPTIMKIFVGASRSLNEKLSLNEKIDRLINFDVNPTYIPIILNLSQEEIIDMVSSYQDKLSTKNNLILQQLPEIFHLLSGNKEKSSEELNALIAKGWNQLHACNELIGIIRKNELIKTAEIFLEVLIQDHNNLASLIGIGMALSCVSENIHECFEWFAKAYSLKPKLTIQILTEQRFNKQLQKLADRVENFI